MSRVGESFLVGLIGSGITRSLTPPLHERAADRLRIRYLYRPLDTDTSPLRLLHQQDPSGFSILDNALKLGYNAFNITYPYKEKIISHLDGLSKQAQSLGAVNTVLLSNNQLIGHNTDVTGFSSALDNGINLSPADYQQVTQLGTGGAGSATAYALLEKGTRTLNLFDIDPGRAQEKAQRLTELFPSANIQVVSEEELPDAIAASTGLVNATPIGMHHHPGTPLPLNLLHSGLWVADVIYLPQETPLIQQTRSLGCAVLTGGQMAVGQAADAFKLITGLTPDRSAMYADFQELLVQPQV